MVKRLPILFLAATAWAQQPPPAADPESVLRERIQQFYQLQVEGKHRQAESMVADDTKDDYYNGRKPDIKAFRIDSIEMDKDSAHAKVVMKVKVVFLMPGAGAQIIELAPPTYWKMENGEWRWYIPRELKDATPFGKMALKEDGSGFDMKGAAPGGIEKPDVGALQGQVSIDQHSVELSAAAPDSVITISNGLPGPTDLRVDPHVEMIKGLTVKVDKLHLDQGEKTQVHLHFLGNAKIADVVEIVASPLNLPLDISVRTK